MVVYRGTNKGARCLTTVKGNADFDRLMTPEYYREQATRCRRLARDVLDREIEKRLLEIAEEFEKQALELEKSLEQNHN
jgi:hypothetical protein